MAIAAGADILGLVSAMPSGPGVIDEPLISRIIATVSDEVETFLLTSLTDPDEIVAQHRRCPASALQLVDEINLSAYDKLRERIDNTQLVQVIHVTGSESVEQALRVAPRVDALLLDSGNPALPVRELGGTGRTHDWALSAEIVRHCDCPVFLAGGLDGDNISEALNSVRPAGVDLCSGVRTGDRLDEGKLRGFIGRVRQEIQPHPAA